MAKAVKKTDARAEALRVSLGDPGMTPMLQAGLGGLAAALRAIARRRDPNAAWPAPVALGAGWATVQPDHVEIEWGDGSPEETLKVLFAEAFKIQPKLGYIELAGTFDPLREVRAELANAWQSALKVTFLQHGKTTQKKGPPRPWTFTVDSDLDVSVEIQGYQGFAHQQAYEDVVKALKTGDVSLAGWAYPGAVQKHIGWGETKCGYSASQALCGLFALVGCVSYLTPTTGGGAIVIPEPTDLVKFAELRPSLSPRSLADAYASGAGDAMLAVEVRLRMDAAGRRAVGSVHAVTLQATPWASQQKSRTTTVEHDGLDDALLDVYAELTSLLPARVRVLAKASPPAGKRAAKKTAGGDDRGGAGFFVATSALRGFVSDNLARGRRWFDGFATATVGLKTPRFIHQYRTRDNLGALFIEERKGLIKMLEHLQDDARVSFVRSVHQAIRNRLGAIAEETRDNPVARKKRWQDEREKWRIRFAGAKTHEQVRAGLADLWSRAGSVRELRERWEVVLPLLGSERWQEARDLALVALASYASAVDDADEETGDETAGGNDE
jgi:CRISPR-associated protein Cas8a1/Csx13